MAMLCTNPLATSTPTLAFIQKCHWLPSRVLLICSSRFRSAFLVLLGVAISVASTNRVGFHRQPFLSQMRADFGKYRLGQQVLLPPMPEVQDRHLVRHVIANDVQQKKPLETVPVVDRLFGVWIAQVEPLL